MSGRRTCWVHGIPDCSPLLNGCSRLTEGHEPPQAVRELNSGQAGALRVLYRLREGVTSRDVAAELWPNHPAWTAAPRLTGRGVSLPDRAGKLLWELGRRGLCTGRGSVPRRWTITQAGIDTLDHHHDPQEPRP